MATLINIKWHTFIKSYFQSLGGKIPPNIFFDKKLGVYWLLNSCENGITCTFSPFYVLYYKSFKKMFENTWATTRVYKSKALFFIYMLPSSPVTLYFHHLCKHRVSQIRNGPQEVSRASCWVQICGGQNSHGRQKWETG